MSHFVLIRGPRFLVGTTWQSADPYTSFWTNEDPVIATLNDIGRQRKLVGDRWEPGTVDHAILKSSGDNMLTCAFHFYTALASLDMRRREMQRRQMPSALWTSQYGLQPNPALP